MSEECKEQPSRATDSEEKDWKAVCKLFCTLPLPPRLLPLDTSVSKARLTPLPSVSTDPFPSDAHEWIYPNGILDKPRLAEVLFTLSHARPLTANGPPVLRLVWNTCLKSVDHAMALEWKGKRHGIVRPILKLLGELHHCFQPPLCDLRGVASLSTWPIFNGCLTSFHRFQKWKEGISVQRPMFSSLLLVFLHLACPRPNKAVFFSECWRLAPLICAARTTAQPHSFSSAKPGNSPPSPSSSMDVSPSNTSGSSSSTPSNASGPPSPAPPLASEAGPSCSCPVWCPHCPPWCYMGTFLRVGFYYSFHPTTLHTSWLPALVELQKPNKPISKTNPCVMLHLDTDGAWWMAYVNTAFLHWAIPWLMTSEQCNTWNRLTALLDDALLPSTRQRLVDTHLMLPE